MTQPAAGRTRELTEDASLLPFPVNITNGEKLSPRRLHRFGLLGII
jgi:hypothetical protein